MLASLSTDSAVATAYPAFHAARNSHIITTYLVGLMVTPVLASMNTTTTLLNSPPIVDRATWVSRWSAYYVARTDLQKEIQVRTEADTALAAEKAGTQTGNDRAQLNEHGMVVFSGQTQRVRIGNLTALANITP